MKRRISLIGFAGITLAALINHIAAAVNGV
jgi:hypothetical protein